MTSFTFSLPRVFLLAHCVAILFSFVFSFSGYVVCFLLVKISSFACPCAFHWFLLDRWKATTFNLRKACDQDAMWGCSLQHTTSRLGEEWPFNPLKKVICHNVATRSKPSYITRYMIPLTCMLMMTTGNSEVRLGSKRSESQTLSTSDWTWHGNRG